MVNIKSNKGFSLNELLVVITIMAILIAIGVPVSKSIMSSVNSSAGLRTMIAACLTNARAIAIKEQKYAGIRFQSDTDGNQYIVFIINDDNDAPLLSEFTADPYMTGTGLANGFRAITGHEPIKLPGDGRVMDLKLRSNTSDAEDPSYEVIDDSDEIDDTIELMDTSTFSIIFSPAGKLVTHQVRVRNRHGQTESGYKSTDKIFNTLLVVEAGNALLCQDDYPKKSDELGLGQEYSRKSFIIYSKIDMEAVGDSGYYWPKYLQHLDEIYVNPYTGELVGGQVE